MKDKFLGKNRSGQAAVEMLIALVVLVFASSAAIMVTFGSQSTAVDTETNGEALLIARKELEKVHSDVSILNTFGIMAPIVENEIYTKQLKVEDISPCLKKVESAVDWNVSPLRSQQVGLSTFISDVAGAFALGGGCDSTVPGNWDTPTELGSTPPNFIDGEATGVDIVRIGNKKYGFLTSVNSSANKDDLWVIDVTNPSTIQPPVNQIHVSPGLNAIDIAQIEVGGVLKTYAFTVNNDDSDHLIVFDMSDPLDSTPLTYVRTLPDLTGGVGRSIFYYDRKVYIGTEYVPCNSGCFPEKNNELHIFDVSDPTAPFPIGSIDVDRNVNAIAVRDGVAFLATGPGSGPSWTPLKVYDVDPLSSDYKQEIDTFPGTGNEQGRSLYLLGGKLYFGLDSISGQRSDFYVLDVTDPADIKELGSKNLGLNPNNLISGIVVQGNYAFLVTTDSNGSQDNTLYIMDVVDPSKLRKINKCAAPPWPQNASGIRYSEDLVFVSFRSNEAFRIIHDNAQTTCNL